MDTTSKTISELHEGLVTKKFTAVELTKSYLETIAKFEPEINAFVNLTAEKALAAAEVVDKKIAAGEEISALAGIPSALKDNFNWTDTITTASSHSLEDYISPYNATVVESLLAEDAVFVGKANLDAFAHGSSTETSDFGVTKNPFNKDHVAGGSSGGSAAAVAANMSTYAIGSETAGSVRGPAAWCGVYGFVPTYGRNSRFGLAAMGSSLDRPGVLANSVLDCAIVTDAMAGHDSKDATSLPLEKTSYAANLKAADAGLTLGVPTVFLDARINPEVAARTKEVISAYEKLGAKVKEISLLDPKYAMAVYTIICRSEVSSNLARIDGIRYGTVADSQFNNILDQISANREQGFGNEAKQRSLTGGYALSAGYFDAYYLKALKVRRLIIDDFAKAFKEVDLIIGPTMPTVATKIGEAANNPLFGELADILTEPSALAGLPCISMPAGLDNSGLPIGVQLIGKQGNEQLVLDYALTYEQKIARK